MRNVNLGEVLTLFNGTTIAGQISSHPFHLSYGVESVLVSLFAEDVQDTLSVEVFTLTEEGKEALVISFPTLSAPTTNLLMQKAAIGMQRFKVVVTTGSGGPATFEIRAKGISSGTVSVRIEGALGWTTSKTTVASTNTVVVPAALTDRSGMALRNCNFQTTDILFVAESTAKLDAGQGYPILPGEALQIDVKAGSEIYGKSSGSDIDTRIIQVGG
jgi:hypothetical protein